jgi:DNA-binding response OmpR family regulator/HPt (histidine-containing phosphotransfer) domain-containing protein
MKILLVEDDEIIAEMLRKTLASQHYLVELAAEGQAGWELVEAFEYDLILLDVMLPKLDGISFCRRLRAKGDRTPILLLTAQDSSTNKVKGLDAGADDYVIKPFDLDELLARIRALLRRGSSIPLPVLEWGSLRLDPSSCEVTYNEKLLHLTSKEYAIVELLLRNTHRIFSQSALLDHLWSFDEPPTENTVRAHIKSLRQKLKKAGAPELIETVYGLGYRLKSRDQESAEEQRSRGAEEHKRAGEAGGAEDKGTRRQGDKGNFSPSPPLLLSPSSSLATHYSPLSISQQQIPAELIPLWERFQPKYCDRITVLEQAIAAIGEGTFNEALRQQANREAHTLVGTLGSFGLVEASRLCRELEQVFQAGSALSQAQVEWLSGLVAALRQELGTREQRRGGDRERGRQGEVPLLTESQSHPLTNQLTTHHSSSSLIKQQPQLLIVDDDAELALTLISEAKAWGMQAEAAKDLTTARKAIARVRPDVVLLDLCLSHSKEKGFELLAELATAQPPVPAVVFTVQQSFVDRIEVARLGGRGFLQKPVPPSKVMEAIAQVLQKSSTPEAKLMIVDDDSQLLDFLHNLLAPWGFKLALLSEPHQFWYALEQSAPDLLILDIEMGELSGIDLCQVVRNDPYWSELPVLFLSARADAQTVHRVFTAGADDYINKPIVGPELVARVLNRLERSKIRRQLLQLSGTPNVTNQRQPC